MEARDTHRLIKNILREAGREEAPAGFAGDVMKKIGELPARAADHGQLISGRGWILISGIAAALVLWALAGQGLSPETAEPLKRLAGWSASLRLPHWEWPELSRPFTYAGMALIAFALLHMAWIYRYLHNRWSY